MMSDKPTADEMAKMIDTAIARAEAAEKRIAVATEMARDANREANREREAKETAIARIAALEAQPAATAWRPVTDKPRYNQMVEVQIHGRALYDGMNHLWDIQVGDVWISAIPDDSPFVEWRPLTPPSGE